MDLFEYQGKQYFARYDIPVSPGGVADTVDEAVVQAEKAGYPVVVKAQVQVGGRGKAGGIQLANNTDEVRKHATKILGMDIKGHVVKRLWVEHASDIAKEYYASFTLDRSAKQFLGMLSAEGEVEIEVVAEKNPGAIARLYVNPAEDSIKRQFANGSMRLNSTKRLKRAQSIFCSNSTAVLSKVMPSGRNQPVDFDPHGEVHALDAKVSLDDSAAFRHPEWDEFRGVAGHR